jgi:hypothetical protein
LTTFTFSTRESYAQSDPFYLNPPMMTDDGHTQAVAHGNRTIPMVGSLRLPYIDISLADFNEDPVTAPLRNPADGCRVYADDFEDAFATYAGVDCQEAVATIRSYEAGGDATVEETAHANLVLRAYRSRYALAAAAIAQRKINARAQSTNDPDSDSEYEPMAGLWGTLSDEEQKILTDNARPPYDPSGAIVTPAAQGIVVDWDLSDSLENPDAPPAIVKRGSWSADVPLVVCEQNYWPLGNAMPLWETTIVEHGGHKIRAETSGNTIKTIRVGSSEEFFEDLNDLGVIIMTVRPPYPLDSYFREEAFEYLGLRNSPDDTTAETTEEEE